MEHDGHRPYPDDEDDDDDREAAERLRRYRYPTEDDMAHDVLDMLEMGLSKRDVLERGGIRGDLPSVSRFRRELEKQYQAFDTQRSRVAAAAHTPAEHTSPFLPIDGRFATPIFHKFSERSPGNYDEKRWFGYIVSQLAELRYYLGGAPDDIELQRIKHIMKDGYITGVAWRGLITYRSRKIRVSILMYRGQKAHMYVSGTSMKPWVVDKIW